LELVEKAALQVQPAHTDLILSIGGGSAIGLAKALALRFHLPIWAVPTTYAGSEMSNIYGIEANESFLLGTYLGGKSLCKLQMLLLKVLFLRLLRKLPP
jgi:hypothetical protein